MKPRKDDDALVDLLDVILRDGVILRADVIISVAEIPLVGLKLTAALAGMETMTEYGLFEEWDARHRLRASTREQSESSSPAVPGPRPRPDLDGRIGTASRPAVDRSDRPSDSDEPSSETVPETPRENEESAPEAGTDSTESTDPP